MTAIWFALAAGLGASLRHGINQLGQGWRGTLVINVSGAFALGWVAAVGGDAFVTVVGGGFLGAFTTFSALSLEVDEAPRRERLVIVVATFTVGIAAAFAGAALG